MPRERRDHLEDQIRDLYVVTTQLQHALMDLARRLGPDAERLTADRLAEAEAALQQVRGRGPTSTGDTATG